MTVDDAPEVGVIVYLPIKFVGSPARVMDLQRFPINETPCNELLAGSK